MALYRHVLSGTFPGEQWSVRIHSVGSGSLTAAQTAWETAVGDLWDDWAPLICADVSATEASTAALDEATGLQLTKTSSPLALPGTNAGDCLPFQCAPVVSFRTAVATRAGRGRIYAPSLGVDQQAGGTLISSAQTALLNGAVAMFAALTGGGFTGSLYSYTTHAETSITSVDVGNVIDTQRRRRNKLVETRVSANV